MRKFKLFFILIGICTLIACGNNSAKSVKDVTTVNSSTNTLESVAKEDITAKDTATTGKETTSTSLSVDDFKNVPDEIEGCGCYFSDNEETFKRNEYLFVASYDSVAFISIDKKLVRLKMLSTTREPETFGDHDHSDIYSSDKYKVSLDIRYKKSSGEETWLNNGTITIESKDGQKAVKKFFGECGC